MSEAKTPNGWTIIDQEAGLLSMQYSFGGGMASGLVARIGEDSLLVISPPCGYSDEVLADLDAFGKVTAIIAPNGFHYLGLAQWQRRWPEARTFASDGAKKRICRKCRDLPRPFEPLSALEALLPDHVTVMPAPHMKIDDTYLRVDTAQGAVWYITDALCNFEVPPKPWLLGLLFRWTGSAPGFSANKPANLLMIKDKRAFKTWLLGEIGRAPPWVIVLGHGPMISGPHVVARVNEVIQTRM